MPFRSQAQRRWMFAKKPELAKTWAAHTPKGAKLPEHVHSKEEEGKEKAAGATDLLRRGAGAAGRGIVGGLRHAAGVGPGDTLLRRPAANAARLFFAPRFPVLDRKLIRNDAGRIVGDANRALDKTRVGIAAGMRIAPWAINGAGAIGAAARLPNAWARSLTKAMNQPEINLFDHKIRPDGDIVIPDNNFPSYEHIRDRLAQRMYSFLGRGALSAVKSNIPGVRDSLSPEDRAAGSVITSVAPAIVGNELYHLKDKQKILSGASHLLRMTTPFGIASSRLQKAMTPDRPADLGRELRDAVTNGKVLSLLNEPINAASVPAEVGQILDEGLRMRGTTLADFVKERYVDPRARDIGQRAADALLPPTVPPAAPGAGAETVTTPTSPAAPSGSAPTGATPGARALSYLDAIRSRVLDPSLRTAAQSAANLVPGAIERARAQITSPETGAAIGRMIDSAVPPARDAAMRVAAPAGAAIANRVVPEVQRRLQDNAGNIQAWARPMVDEQVNKVAPQLIRPTATNLAVLGGGGLLGYLGGDHLSKILIPDDRSLSAHDRKRRAQWRSVLALSSTLATPFAALAAVNKLQQKRAAAPIEVVPTKAAPARSILPELKEIKRVSDAGNWGRKGQLVRALLRYRSREFREDSRKRGIVGVTHAPTKFRFHIPADVLSGYKLEPLAPPPPEEAEGGGRGVLKSAAPLSAPVLGSLSETRKRRAASKARYQRLMERRYPGGNPGAREEEDLEATFRAMQSMRPRAPLERRES